MSRGGRNHVSKSMQRVYPLLDLLSDTTNKVEMVSILRLSNQEVQGSDITTVNKMIDRMTQGDENFAALVHDLKSKVNQHFHAADRSLPEILKAVDSILQENVPYEELEHLFRNGFVFHSRAMGLFQTAICLLKKHKDQNKNVQLLMKLQIVREHIKRNV